MTQSFLLPPLRRTIIDIQQLNLIMELLGKPSEEFMDKISSDSVIISFFRLYTHASIFRLMYGLPHNCNVLSSSFFPSFLLLCPSVILCQSSHRKCALLLTRILPSTGLNFISSERIFSELYYVSSTIRTWFFSLLFSFDFYLSMI